LPEDLVLRTAHRLNPNAHRVIAKLFVPGEETSWGTSRAHAVMTRVLALDEAEVADLAAEVLARYGTRHHDLAGILSRHADIVAHEMQVTEQLTEDRHSVIGAYFTHEYSPEAAGLFNPSMAAHPDQSGLTAGQLRFVMTVRCVGEGHLSAIGFRTGVLGPGADLVVDEPEPLLVMGASHPASHRRRHFHGRLADLRVDHDTVQLLLDGLAETFTTDELNDALAGVHEHFLHRESVQQAIEQVRRVAHACYDIEFPTSTGLTSRLLWPTALAERNGMEDARLVRFGEDGGGTTYLAPYTAFDGARVSMHLLATDDFREFRVTPMAGQAAQNKGLALFPRRIGGRYVALSQWDRESLSVAYSDDCEIWEDSTMLLAPQQGWDLIQVGNGGSPIELAEGWLVLTHGVGPMRAYALGAILLSLTDPTEVIARLPVPLLTSTAEERDGYVPNVVYTCGALLHDGVLTIPYGISDGAIGFAQIEVDKLLAQMVAEPR
jgi:predicted GH43/DUF377 family glycosyl hydrolase